MSLPAEIVDLICLELDCSHCFSILRLVSRTFTAVVSSHLFRSITLDLLPSKAKSSLERLIKCSNSPYADLIKELEIVYTPKEHDATFSDDWNHPAATSPPGAFHPNGFFHALKDDKFEVPLKKTIKRLPELKTVIVRLSNSVPSSRQFNAHAADCSEMVRRLFQQRDTASSGPAAIETLTIAYHLGSPRARDRKAGRFVGFSDSLARNDDPTRETILSLAQFRNGSVVGGNAPTRALKSLTLDFQPSIRFPSWKVVEAGICGLESVSLIACTATSTDWCNFIGNNAVTLQVLELRDCFVDKGSWAAVFGFLSAAVGSYGQRLEDVSLHIDKYLFSLLSYTYAAISTNPGSYRETNNQFLVKGSQADVVALRRLLDLVESRLMSDHWGDARVAARELVQSLGSRQVVTPGIARRRTDMIAEAEGWDDWRP